MHNDVWDRLIDRPRALALGVMIAAGLLIAAMLTASAASAAQNSVWEQARSWTTPGYAVAVDDAGQNVYVADYLGEQVLHHSNTGKAAGRWADSALAVDVGSDGTVWSVGDFTARHYSSAGTLLATVGDDPYDDIAVGPLGDVYTVQATVGYVGLERWSGSGAALGSLALVSPVAVAVDAAGYVYVADYAAGEILRLTRDLLPAGDWSLPRSPTGLATDAQGRVYVTYGTRYVDVFNTTGTRLARVRATPKTAELANVDVTAAGRIYAMDRPDSGEPRVVVLVTSSKATIRSRAIRTNKRHRKALVLIACAAGESSCSGRVQIHKGKRLLGTGRYAVNSGTKKRAVVKLNSRARRALAKAKRLKVRVALKANAGQAARRMAVLVR